MNTDILRSIGLTNGEIKIYFMLLENGSSKTGAIIKKSDVHSSKVYQILDKLIKKGLASYIIENNVRYYQASDPKQLVEYIHQKKREIDEQEQQIKKIIPEILTKQRFAEHKQSAYIYEGIKGIKAVYEIMLDEWQHGEEYLVFTPGEEYQNKEINKFFKKHHLKRIERGVIVKVLALETQRNFYKKNYNRIPNFRFRYTKNSLPATINIIHNKVSTLIWEPQPTAFVIESVDVAKKYRTFFQNLWATAKR